MLRFKDKGDTNKILKLESYKGPLTRSKMEILETYQENQGSTSQVLIIAMGDREEERNEIPNNNRRENEGRRNQRRRPRSSPLNL
jgi:hypothetical protein